ncbi:UTRA domain-containing protein [Peribacillus loiseleuriae]|uniref:UTRA domain-containing protein n=1 Tax=Peribacillus loiseleuriae TaxID=1679170 RepID=UPI003D056E9B
MTPERCTFKHVGLKIGYATQSFESTIASDVGVISLSIAKHFPILFIQRTTYLDAGRPLEFIRLKDHDISFIKTNQQRGFSPYCWFVLFSLCSLSPNNK